MGATGEAEPEVLVNWSGSSGSGSAVAVENDCEDQGFSSVSEGCNVWPCKRQPLQKWSRGWRCTKCGGCY